jgi:2-oxoglutarate dehydrogenase E2 component (dihydrolipoamide succinyltransferase)
MADITMPQLGETVTEGTITKWMKQVGDKVEEDEVLFEVSTDKVDSEVPSPSGGYLAEILVQEGETADVGATLAVISDSPPDGGGADGAAEGEATAEAEDEAAEEPAAAEEEPAADEAEAEAEEKAAKSEDEPEPEPGDEPEEAATKAQASGKTEQEATDEADGESDAKADESEAPEGEAAAERAPSRAGTRPADGRPSGRPQGGSGGKVLSPVVRRLLAEHDLDPESIEGTGAGGRITRDDVLKVIDGGATKTAAKASGDGAAKADAPVEMKAEPEAPAPGKSEKPSAPRPAVRSGDRDETVPFSNIRKRTAEHMVRSQDTSAHTLTVVEVDYSGIEKVRDAVKDKFKADEGFGLSYLPFIARALIDAIEEFPRINASVGNDELIVHKYVNLGIAVDLNHEGLIVPVVHDADTKRLRALAREIADLASRARGKKLGADDISGGTFTITNPGGYGTMLTFPIINQPQVAILSTDGVKRKPVAVELPDGTWGVAVHPTGNLALAFDHRANDGAYASAFLAKLKEIIETRDWSTEL